MVNTPMKDRTGGGWKRLWRGLLAGTLAVATLAGTITSAAYADPISGGSSDVQSDAGETTPAPDPTVRADGGSSSDAGSGFDGGYAVDPEGREYVERWRENAAKTRGGIQLYADTGGSGFAPGDGGTVAGAMITWKYRDNNDGGWGGFTIANFKKALAATKNTTGGKVNWNEYPGSPTAAKAQEAMDMAKSNCLKRWDTVHPDQKGKGSCRMVGVGVVATPTTHNYDGHGFADPPFWQNAWNKLVTTKKYSNNNKAYDTNDTFDSDPGYNVDKLAASAWANSPVVIVIALNQSEPSPIPPQNYKLTVSTKASGRFGTAGGTNPVTDAITLKNNANNKEKVTGQITLTTITLDGTTHVSPLKRFTTSVTSTVNVKFNPGDVVKSWKTWPAGEYWFDVTVPKQQHMSAAATHNGRNDKNESWKANYKLTIRTKATGHTLTGGSKPVSDTITLSNNGNASQSVNGTITLNVKTTSGTVTKAKKFTGKTNGSVKVSFNPKDVNAKWVSWPIGSYWYDVTIPKQGNMSAAATHAGQNDKNESWKVTGYKLTIRTKATGHTLTGGSKPVTDTITLSNDGNANETVNGTITLNVKTTSGTLKKAKKFTGTTNGDTKVSFTPKEVNAKWTVWPSGDYWYDVTIPKQQGMNAAATHKGQNDANESWHVVTPPTKTITGMDGKTDATGKDLVADSPYVANVTGEALDKGEIWLTDETTVNTITFGTAGKDDKSKITVTSPDGKTVTADIIISNTGKGRKVTAHVANTIAGKYTLHVPTYPKADGNPATIPDTGIVCYDKQSATCMTTDVKTMVKTTPKPDKVWARTSTEATTVNDPEWTNRKGADTLTFIEGQTVSVTVNGYWPKNQLNDLTGYTISDDWSKSATHVDLSDPTQVRVYVDGKDQTSMFTINSDKTTHRVTATAKPALLKGTAGLAKDKPIKLVVTGSLRVNVLKPGQTVSLPNNGEESWNSERKPTNEPTINVFKPSGDKAWILYRNNKWIPVIDPEHSNTVGGDKHTFLDGDKVGAVVNTTIPAKLAKLDTFTMTDDYTASDYVWDADTKDVHVYMKPVANDSKSTVTDIITTGTDVTNDFTITSSNGKVTASMKPDKVKQLVGLSQARQYTLLVGGTIHFANGKGAEQVRKDYQWTNDKGLTFCASTQTGGDTQTGFTNKGVIMVGKSAYTTNQPELCGHIPPVVKKVVAEGSQGGDQSDANSKVVYPGQKVEYQLTVSDTLPNTLAYDVTSVAFEDRYDQYLEPDMQTVEVLDLTTGNTISKTEYATDWDEQNHRFTLTFSKENVQRLWKKGQTVRLQVRFEGTVSKNAPTTRKVDNQWYLHVNNSITPSNIVENTPPDTTVKKEDTQQDPSINIDGKTAMLGDRIYYRVTMDAHQTNQAYKVWRLGISDDYDDQYLSLDMSNVQILSDTGVDVTSRFNMQDKEGVLYVFAKTVDTLVPATGRMVKGDPQPSDLKAYETTDEHDPLTQPAIDQTLLGHTYTVVMPMTVTKVTDGYTVRNTANLVMNTLRKTSNTVTNPLKPINPVKDVNVKVNGASVNRGTIPLNSTFLYRLDSSILPKNRAYPLVEDWHGVDRLDVKHDEYTGQWAVYATRDLYAGDTLIAKTGERIGGSDPITLPNMAKPLFEATFDKTTGVFTVTATRDYLTLASDDSRETGWTVYIQCKRIQAADRVENTWDETWNKTTVKSNLVWTTTPPVVPSLHLEKWDEQSGWPHGDRDKASQALTVTDKPIRIRFTVTNTSRNVWYQTKSLKLDDQLIDGVGKVTNIEYPKDWETRILAPGEKVELSGRLVVKGDNTSHHDRATVTGIPLTQCPIVDPTPFDGVDDESTLPGIPYKGMILCATNNPVVSNSDDWFAKRKPLANTGTTIMIIVTVMIGLAALGVMVMLVARHRHTTVGRHDDR